MYSEDIAQGGGDVVSLKDASKQLAVVLEAVQSPERDVPDYIDVDHNKMSATYARRPIA